MTHSQESKIITMLSELQAATLTLVAAVARLEERVSALEVRMSALEDRVTRLETRIDALESRMDTLEQKLDQHIEKSAQEHAEIISIVNDSIQHTATLVDGVAVKCTARFKRHAGRIHLLEKTVL